MASSSGNSSTPTQNSGSEGDLQVLMDQRKRKRMQSNRESARRSRMRKQKHLDDLMGQVTQLSKDNNQILTSINITNQHLMNVEAENSILRAQVMELSQRLESLNGILNFINTTSSVGGVYGTHQNTTAAAAASADSFINPLDLLYHNQPIMASATDMFHY